MTRLRSLAIEHPVAAFFALTYSVSWPLFIIVLFLFPGNMVVQGILGNIATFGPVIAGITISALSDTTPRQRQGLKRPVMFLAGWFASTLVLVLFIWQVRGVSLQPGLVAFLGLLALLPAFVLSCAFSARATVRQYLGSLLRPKGNVGWYLLAFLTFPIVQLAGYLITRVMGQEAGELIRGGLSPHTGVVICLTFLQGFLFAGGINEESGWRGFAIPKLQATFSPLAASLIVWVFWALWHLFYDISSHAALSQILFNRLVLNLLWSVLFVWVFNRTGGSILAPAIFHPAMNTFGETLPRTHAATVLFVLLALGAILYDRMWRRMPFTLPAPDSASSGALGERRGRSGHDSTLRS
jgi:membrane protease YdiL (CAAX protease family)